MDQRLGSFGLWACCLPLKLQTALGGKLVTVVLISNLSLGLLPQLCEQEEEENVMLTQFISRHAFARSQSAPN
jgi:hypothetical protein